MPSNANGRHQSYDIQGLVWAGVPSVRISIKREGIPDMTWFKLGDGFRCAVVLSMQLIEPIACLCIGLMARSNGGKNKNPSSIGFMVGDSSSSFVSPGFSVPDPSISMKYCGPSAQLTLLFSFRMEISVEGYP